MCEHDRMARMKRRIWDTLQAEGPEAAMALITELSLEELDCQMWEFELICGH